MITGKTGVASIEDKMREARLHWFEHIKRRSMDALVRRGETIVCSDHRRRRGMSKKSWREVIRHDLKILGLVENMT